MNTMRLIIMYMGITVVTLHGMLPNGKKLEALNNELKLIEYLQNGDQYIEKFNTEVYTALEYAGQLHVLITQLKSSTASDLNKKGYHSFTQEFLTNQDLALKKFHEWTIYFHKLRLSNQTPTDLHGPNHITLVTTIQRNSEARALIHSIKIILRNEHIQYTPFNYRIQKQLADLAAAQSIIASNITHLLENPEIRKQPLAIEECNQIILTFQQEYEKLHNGFQILAHLRLTNNNEYEEACVDTGTTIIEYINTWFKEKQPQIQHKLVELSSKAH